MMDELTALQRGWYVSRRIPLAHDQAALSLGVALQAPPPDDAIAARAFHHSPSRGSGVVGLRAARAFPGRLRLGALTPGLPVEIEIEPWSQSESVLGLRPVRRPPAFRTDRYFRQAVTLLADLEARVLDAVVESTDGTALRRAS